MAILLLYTTMAIPTVAILDYGKVELSGIGSKQLVRATDMDEDLAALRYGRPLPSPYPSPYPSPSP